METQHRKQNLLKYSLYKKGVVTFIFSKLAFLIFVIIISSAFFYVIVIEHDIQNLDKLAKESDSIANTINMVSSSKFKVWTVYKSDLNAKINFGENNFTIYTDKEIKRGLLFQINSTGSDNNIPISCLNISNFYGTVIKKCR